MKETKNISVKVNDILPISSINISRYTWKAWKKCYPESSYDEWENTTLPDNALDFIFYASNAIDYDDEIKYRICTIDEDYFKWLDENNKENTSDNRIKYINTISNETADYLLRKNNFDLNTDYIFLPFIFSSNNPIASNISFEIPWDIKSIIYSYLKKELDAEEIIIGDYFISTTDMYDYTEEIFDLISNNKSIKQYKKEVSPNNIANVLYTCLPIIIKKRLKSSILDLESDEILEYETFLFDIENISNTKANSFNITKNVKVQLFPFICDPLEAVELENEFKKEMIHQNKLKQNGYLKTKSYKKYIYKTEFK